MMGKLYLFSQNCHWASNGNRGKVNKKIYKKCILLKHKDFKIQGVQEKLFIWFILLTGLLQIISFEMIKCTQVLWQAILVPLFSNCLSGPAKIQLFVNKETKKSIFFSYSLWRNKHVWHKYGQLKQIFSF